MERIQSFKSFSQVKVQLKEQTTQKEISAKRRRRIYTFCFPGFF